MGLLANEAARTVLETNLLANITTPAASPVDGLLRLSQTLASYTALSDQGISTGGAWVGAFTGPCHSTLLTCLPVTTAATFVVTLELALVAAWAAAGSTSPLMAGATTVTVGIGALPGILTPVTTSLQTTLAPDPASAAINTAKAISTAIHSWHQLVKLTSTAPLTLPV